MEGIRGVRSKRFGILKNMIEFIFTKHSKENFSRLDPEIQARISQKFVFLKTHPNIYFVLSKLEGSQTPRYRLRIGSFRLILRQISFDKNNIKFLVSDIGHRREIYN
jgi:mRNA-degrading endonuclease RelE of RelBE toxin-antitoxin system